MQTVRQAAEGLTPALSQLLSLDHFSAIGLEMKMQSGDDISWKELTVYKIKI